MIGQSLASAMAPRAGPLVGPVPPARRPGGARWWPVRVTARSKAVPTSVSGVRNLIRVLRGGGYTAILPDQVPPSLIPGVWAPFFASLPTP